MNCVWRSISNERMPKDFNKSAREKPCTKAQIFWENISHQGAKSTKEMDTTV